jgi:hypothetical protein
MIIKSVAKNGDAVEYNPEEALAPAVTIAAAKQLNKEFVFWVGSTPKASSFRSAPQNGGGYEAFAEGIVEIGKTRINDDKFFLAKPYSFSIHYRSSKDEIGAPHIDVVSFTYEPTDRNPSKVSGPVEKSAPKPQGGKVSTKVAQSKDS